MGDALLTSYYALYFIENGLDAQQQSLLLGVIPFSLFMGCFILGFFNKNRAKTLWLFRLCVLMEAVLALCYAFSHDFVSLLVLTIIVSFFNGAPFAFIESHAALALEGKHIPYSRIRKFGTLGYIVSLFLGGFLLRHLPFSDVYYFSCAFFATALGLSFVLKPIQEKATEEDPNHHPASLDKRGVILLLISIVLLTGAFNASAFLLPVQLKSLGLPDSDYSFIRAIGIAGEFVSLLLMPLFHRFFKNKKIPLFIGGGLLLLSTALCVLVTDPYALAYSNLLLSGWGKSFVFAYQVSLFAEFTGKDKLGKILTVNTGLINVVVTLLNLGSSAIYLNIGFPAFFGIITAMEGVGLIVFAFLPHRKTQPGEEEFVVE